MSAPFFVTQAAAPIMVASLLFASSFGSIPACAAVSVQGDGSSVRVVANQAKVSEVLGALNSALGIHYETMVNLDSVIGGTFMGPLRNVLRSILYGYNYYIIETQEKTLIVIVVEKAGTLPAASQTFPPEPTPKPDAYTKETRHTR
jgi:hypothetical protein